MAPFVSGCLSDLLRFLHLNLKTTLSVPTGPAEGAQWYCSGVALVKDEQRNKSESMCEFSEIYTATL